MLRLPKCIKLIKITKKAKKSGKNLHRFKFIFLANEYGCDYILNAERRERAVEKLLNDKNINIKNKIEILDTLFKFETKENKIKILKILGKFPNTEIGNFLLNQHKEAKDKAVKLAISRALKRVAFSLSHSKRTLAETRKSLKALGFNEDNIGALLYLFVTTQAKENFNRILKKFKKKLR